MTLEKLIGKDINIKIKNIPDIDLNLKELIDIIAQGYKIETVPFYGNEASDTELMGLHIDDGKELSVLINKHLPKEERILTIIHEMYHCIARKYNTTQNEQVIQYLAIKKYTELYGDPEF